MTESHVQMTLWRKIPGFTGIANKPELLHATFLSLSRSRDSPAGFDSANVVDPRDRHARSFEGGKNVQNWTLYLDVVMTINPRRKNSVKKERAYEQSLRVESRIETKKEYRNTVAVIHGQHGRRAWTIN